MKEMAKGIEVDTKGKSKHGIFVGKGLGTAWMSVSEYARKLDEVGGAATTAAVYYREKNFMLEQKIEHGLKLVREVALQDGSNEQKKYWKKFPEHKAFAESVSKGKAKAAK